VRSGADAIQDSFQILNFLAMKLTTQHDLYE
jgi:hypothetical protein